MGIGQESGQSALVELAWAGETVPDRDVTGTGGNECPQKPVWNPGPPVRTDPFAA